MDWAYWLRRFSSHFRNGDWHTTGFVILQGGVWRSGRRIIMHAGLPAVRDSGDPENVTHHPAQPVRAKDIALLLLLTASAILVHGYHPFVEDAEIYVPGIRKALNPQLYPFNQQFFSSHARLTLFPNLIAISVRITHLRLEWMLLAWHFVCIFMLLFACWRLGGICLGTARAAWGGAALVAALLTMPIAGTALYIMDQYLSTRSFSTAMVMWIVLSTLEKKYLRAAGWVVVTVLIHPLMACFGFFFAGLLVWRQHASSGILRQVASATPVLML